MNSLPDEILVRVFSYLSLDELCLACKLTCSRWYAISQEAALWTNVKVKSHLSDARLLLLAQLMHDSVEVLDCGECGHISENGLKEVFDLGLPCLRHILLPCTGPFDVSLYELLSRSAPQLRKIDNVDGGETYTSSSLLLRSVFPNLEVIVDKPPSPYGRDDISTYWDCRSRWAADVKIVSAKCPNVTTYVCCEDSGIHDPDGIQLIVESFPKLTSLKFLSCSAVDGGFVSKLVSIKGIDRLDSLLFEDAGQLTDEAVEQLALFLPNLTHVTLFHCPCLTDKGIQKLSAACPNLREIYVNNFAPPMDSTWDDIPRTDLTDSSLHSIANGCPDLNDFCYLHSHSITSDGIGALCAQCRNLKYVQLFDCVNVDDDSITALCKLPYVRTLVLDGCDAVSPQGMLQLASSPPPCLERLTFSTSTKSFHGDMAPLVDFVRKCLDTAEFDNRPNRLRRVTVSDVGGAFLQLFCSLCPHLVDLDIRSEHAFSSSNLAAIVRTCRALCQLDVAALTCVDDEVLRCIGENALRLEVLRLGSAVEGVSIMALIELAACAPMLRTVTMFDRSHVIDEELLLAGARNSRNGGHCMLMANAIASDSAEDERLIELHMVPLKYLLSVPEVADVEAEAVDVDMVAA